MERAGKKIDKGKSGSQWWLKRFSVAMRGILIPFSTHSSCETCKHKSSGLCDNCRGWNKFERSK